MDPFCRAGVTRGAVCDFRRQRICLSACSGSSTTLFPAAPQNVTITFNGVTADVAPVTIYTESGFTVSANPGNWVVRTTHGRRARVQAAERAGRGVQDPDRMGPVTIAVCSDTCGNLIQLYQPARTSS